MFAPRGYTAVPQEAVDEEDEDHLTTSYEKRKSHLAQDNAGGMPAEKLSTESEEGNGNEKEPRSKRNRVRFETRNLEEKQEPMSKTRRVCFVISLMICTVTIFVFAFTVPCKHAACQVTGTAPPPTTTTMTDKVKFRGNWTVSFPGYSSFAHGILFLDGELIINFNKSGLEKRNNQKEFTRAGIISLSEEHGYTVSIYNSSYGIKLIGCKSEEEIETCLTTNSRGELQLVEPRRNKVIWSTGILIGSISPSIIVNIADCDGDGVPDILLSYNQLNASHVVHSSSNHSSLGQIHLISGRTGATVGGILTVPQTHLIKQIALHSTRRSTNIIFVLTVGFHGQLKVVPIQTFYEKILQANSGVSTDLFHNSTVNLSQVVSLHPPLMKDMNHDLEEDIVLVTFAGNKHSLTAVDGGKMEKMWRISFGSRKLLSQPVIGHFNDDDTPDILVVLEDPVLALLNQSLIQILNGKNGDILWSRHFKIAQNTSPLSASIGHKKDAFFLWIEKEKVDKYTKIVPSKKSKRNHGGKRTHEIQEHSEDNDMNGSRPRHRRNEASSHIMQSRQKIKSSIREMEEELDTLVEEVNKQYSEPKEQTELPSFNGRTVKLLDKMLKKGIQPPPTIGTHSFSNIRNHTPADLKTVKNSAREYVTSRVRSEKERLSLKQQPSRVNIGQFKDEDHVNQQVGIQDENQNVQRRKETEKISLHPVHPTRFDNQSKSSQILSTNLGSLIELQTDVMDTTKRSNISKPKTAQLASGETSVRILSNKANGISKTENISLQLKTSSSKEKGFHDFILLENATKRWKMDNRSDHETESTGIENTNSSLFHSQQLMNLHGLKNGSMSKVNSKQRSELFWSRGTALKPAQEWTRMSVEKMSHIQKKNESLPNSVKRTSENHQKETDSTLFQNRSKNPSLQLNSTNYLTENNTSLISHEGNFTQRVSTRKRLKKNNATMVEHSNKFHQFDGRKQQNGLRKNAVHTKIPRVNPHDMKQSGDCKGGSSFALIAILPKRGRNSFTIVTQEHSFSDKTATSHTSCNMFWPWINSNPIIRDVKNDGFLEIFYVVNYKKQKQVKMTVKKFSIPL